METSERLRVLFVESDPATARLVGERLREGGFDPIGVRSLRSAGSSMRDMVFAAILVNPDLKDSRGMETVRSVLADAPMTPVILVTETENEEIAAQAIREGAHDSICRAGASAGGLARTVRHAIERKRHEASLAERERDRQRLFSVLDALPHFVYLQASDHSIRFANRRFVELFGKTADRSCFEVFHRHESPCRSCPTFRVFQTKTPAWREWTADDGRSYQIHDSLFVDPSGEELVLEVGWDTTERKRVIEALRESERRYDALFDHSSDGVFILSLDGVHLAVNARGAQMLGYTQAELIGRTNRDVVSPEEFGEAEGVLERIYAGATVPIYLRTFRRRDGTAFPAEVNVTLVRDAEGNPRHIQSIVRDVSERQRAEEALKTADDVVRSIPTGILTFQYTAPDELTLIDANPAALTMVGGDRTDWIGRPFEELWPPEMVERVKRPLLDRMSSGLPYESEGVVRRGGEVRSAFRVRAFSIPDHRVVIAFESTTDECRAQEALAASEAKYRELVEEIDEVIYAVDERGILTYVGPGVQTLLGFSPEELIGRAYESLGPKGELPTAGEMRGRFQRTKELRPEEYRLSARGGRLRWIQTAGRPIYDEDGTYRGFRGVAVDITERKLAEEALRRSEARHRLLFENASLGIGYFTPGGTIVAFNRVAASHMGGEPCDFVGKTPADLYGAERGGDYATRIRKAADTPGSHVYEDVVPLPSGAKHFHSIMTRIEDEGGVVVGVQVISEDVTERRRAERILQLTRHSVDAASLSIFWITEEGCFTFVNETACRSLGYLADELVGKGVWDIDPEFPRTDRAERWQRLKGSDTIVFESTHRRRDGTMYPVEITSKYLRFEGEEYELAFAADISERKRTEEERRTLEAQLRQVQRLESIGTFASGIAHEINNPLMGMINFAELISDRVDDDRLREFAEEIRGEGERVAGIVRNLLSFARQETERRSPARLTDIISASLSLIGALLRKDLIQVEVDVPEDLPRVICRSQQIQQVVVNLLTNARDALNEKYEGSDPNKTLRVSSQVAEDAGVEWVRTTIEDHGIGIPSEIVDRVFDPFFTTKPRDRGTGLGLSISYGIIRDHGGQLWIESVPGGPTRVHVDLQPAPSSE